jgi:hypothetical protein
MGLPALPDDGTVNCSRHVSPRLNKMESPAEKEEPFTFDMVFHAAPVDVPA